jgi:replication factor C small subunit
VEWVSEEYGAEIKDLYSDGPGAYVIAEEYEWLKPDMVHAIVDSQGHQESLQGDNNPMKRREVAETFIGRDNPAKRPGVRQKISEALVGRELGEEAKQKISEANSGNEISREHREAIAEAAATIDRSYMQTEEYRRKLSEAHQGPEPTFPEPYEVEELSHMVRSSWEEAVGKLLVDEGIHYRYEQEFELSEGSYYSDFTVDQAVIEVKGWANERAIEQAEQFIELFPSYRYIVVGNELPCDVHIPWEDRERLCEVLQ